MRKQDDYRTTNEKIRDFVKKHKITILIIGTLLSIILIVCSFLFNFEDAGKAALFFHPFSLILFFIELKSDILTTATGGLKFLTTFTFWIFPFGVAIAILFF